MKARCGLGRQRLAGRATDRYDRAPIGAKIAALPQPHDTAAQRASALRACRARQSNGSRKARPNRIVEAARLL